MAKKLVVFDGEDENGNPIVVSETSLDAPVPDSPALFLTIAWSDRGDVELNLGDVEYFAALGMLDMALRELRDWGPSIGVSDGNGPWCEHRTPWWSNEDDEEEDEGYEHG